MKVRVVLITLALLLLFATCGFCQFCVYGLSTGARWVGMGAAGTAAVDDAAALDFNPANLATMDLGQSADPNAALVWKGSLTVATGALDAFVPGLGVVNPEEGWGAAANYQHAEADENPIDLGSIGFGYRFRNTPLSLGVVYNRVTEHNVVSLGALCQFAQKELPPVRFGAVWANLSEEDGSPSWLNLGLAAPVAPGLLLAVDAYDVTDNAIGSYFCYGAEYQWPQGFAVRAGLFRDDGFAGGIGYKQDNWSVDLACNGWPNDFGSEDDETQWTLTGGFTF